MIRQQNTLQKEITFSGIGVHSGKEVVMRWIPANENHGLVFQRMDLPHCPKIPALANYAKATPRCTTLKMQDCSVQTIEHVLAALAAFNIDNLLIQLSDQEPPIADGSSKIFVSMILEAEILKQDALVQIKTINAPIYYSEGQTHIVALPSDTYKISYTLHYPRSEVIKTQYHTCEVTDKNFQNEIAPARTFALYEEITALMDRGLIQGGSLENAVVIKEEVIFSKEGLRFSNEMVRHKVLDLVGDLALVGVPFLAHIIAIRSGHQANAHLAKQILAAIGLKKDCQHV